MSEKGPLGLEPFEEARKRKPSSQKIRKGKGCFSKIQERIAKSEHNAIKY